MLNTLLLFRFWVYEILAVEERLGYLSEALCDCAGGRHKTPENGSVRR